MRPEPPAQFVTARHYGLDWLRIGAFALLILYHIGMVFAPWDWVIKSPYSIPDLIVPMAMLTPWRLPLLFLVSGYASRALLDRSASPAGFAWDRSARLLLPWGFAMLVIVPPEMWVRVMEMGYSGSFLHFWGHDYWRVGHYFGRDFPSVEHLWFVEYLWAYTMLLAGVLAVAHQRVTALLAAIAGWLATGKRLLWAPVSVLVTAKLALLFVVPETTGLFTDWSGHAQFLPMFIAGFALAGAPSLWPVIARHWRQAAEVAIISGGVVVAVELVYQGHNVPPHLIMAADRAARLAMAWAMAIVLLHMANRLLNHDHAWRKSFGEAVFPCYIIHHPAIVVGAWYVLPLGLPAPVAFAALLAITIAVCAAWVALGRAVPVMGVLAGLRPLRHALRSSHKAVIL